MEQMVHYGRSVLPPVGHLGVSTPAPHTLANGLFQGWLLRLAGTNGSANDCQAAGKVPGCLRKGC